MNPRGLMLGAVAAPAGCAPQGLWPRRLRACADVLVYTEALDHSPVVADAHFDATLKSFSTWLRTMM